MQMCVEYYEKIIENPPKETMPNLKMYPKKDPKDHVFFRCFWERIGFWNNQMVTLVATLGFQWCFDTFFVHLTLPETNSKFAPENGWLEDEAFFLGPALFWQATWVSGGVYVEISS